MRKHNTISNYSLPAGRTRSIERLTECQSLPCEGRTHQFDARTVRGGSVRVRRSFGSLAMRYYPDLSYKSALRQLRNEIRVTRGLLQALKECGYHERQRMITPKQVKVIEDYLGKP